MTGDTTIEQTRCCKKCGQTKLLGLFTKAPKCVNCVSWRCKACHASSEARRRASNLELAMCAEATDLMKTCSKCGQCKHFALFPKVHGRVGSVARLCKDCCTAIRYRAWAKANADRLRTYQAKRNRDPQDRRDAVRRSQLKARETLSDSYIRKILQRGTPLKASDFPPSLVSLKREQILIVQLHQSLKQEIANQLENPNGN